MFSLKRTSSQEPNPTNANPQTALPNNFGKIRTLREDFDNFQSGKKEELDDADSSLPPAQSIPPAPQKTQAPEAIPAASQIPPSPPKKIEENFSAGPVPQIPQTKISGEKKEISNPFGSENYFSDKSPFEDITKNNQTGATNKPSQKRSGGLVVALLSAFLVLTVSGGGFYYYWFFLKKTADVPTTAPVQTPPKDSPQNPPEENISNGKVRALSADLAGGNEAFRMAFQKMASDFISSASENDLIELRPVGKDNRQISAADFISVSSLGLSESIIQKFSPNDYSLFVKKENGEARAGLVFMVSDQTGLSENLLDREKQLPSEIDVVYLGQSVPAEDPAFSSSKYKNADIRYYNFSGQNNLSLDYTAIKGASGGYLVFATSKETIRSILDYMSEK